MALALTIDRMDEQPLVSEVSDTRYGVLRDFCKGCKQDFHGGTYSGVKFEADIDYALLALGEKKYMVPLTLLGKLEEYIAASGPRIWNKKWNKAERDLMAGFSDAIAKDGT